MIKWILPILWSSTLCAQGFLNGNEFTTYDLQGDLYLTCYGNGQRVTVRKPCRKSALLPVSSDYFYTDQKIDGDRVRLKNITEEDGSGFDKTVYYNKEKQRTHRKIKLWAEYQGEKALLREGLNRVAFEFQNKNKDMLLQGQMGVNVEYGGRRLCRDGQDVSYDLYDCYYGDARRFCERYFEWNNYCD